MRKQLATLTLVLLAACDRATLPPPATIDLSAGKTATPVLTVAPTNTPAASTTYTVQPGDTLAKIAQQYQVTVEAILAANGLQNPNLIQVGQELVIPGRGAEGQGGSEASPTPPPPSAAAPAIGGWVFRADMFILFDYEALNCAQEGINYGPEDEQTALGAIADELIQAYVQGADLDALAHEKGVEYLWGNAFAYGREIGDMSIGELIADACGYAQEWQVFDGLDLSPLTRAGVVNIADIRRETATGYERRILVVWKE